MYVISSICKPCSNFLILNYNLTAIFLGYLDILKIFYYNCEFLGLLDFLFLYMSLYYLVHIDLTYTWYDKL